MGFEIYNSLGKQKEAFRPIEAGKVRMYNCGPTVYGRAHIGNLRSFLFADLLRRWLEHLGYDVKQVMNITDVGHLVADEEEGEDKIEAQAKRSGTDPWKIARAHEAQFHEDLAALGVRKASVYPRATDHIEEMLEMIAALIEKGYAYEVDGNVYFDVSRFERYGKLSGNRVEDLDAGARIEVNEEKRHPADFALWKHDAAHLMKWDTRFGPDGFPGWHIECSAMARKHLGDHIDIHTGGEDNVFPHHECEIAQSESFSGGPFANYWMHAKFLQVDGGKMSKSLGNVYTVQDVVDHGYEPRVLRFTLLRGHYRQPLNFTWGIMEDSKKALDGLDRLYEKLTAVAAGEGGATEAGAGAELVAKAREEFEAGMNDDLNVPRGLAAIFGLRGEVNEDRLGRDAAADALQFLDEVNDVLGVIRTEREAGEDDAEIDALIAARKQARADKNWAESDRIRDELDARGILVEDGAAGTTWRRK
ncbi:MAG: cysteine--tRNA ligase [Planctomycetes bacterium]|nr:cysteine--tRNA ligase [Planctomycetota bacterium]